jgi:hypothetical protein
MRIMNIEIVRELARQWRRKADPEPAIPAQAIDEESMPPDTITKSLSDKLVDEAVQDTLKACSQDLEDVIKIFNDFKYPIR